MIVDNYHVLHGTDQKIFDKHRAELAQDYTESYAKDFFYDYKDKPVSFILRNSRQIFSESYYGLPFYRELIAHALINPTAYDQELEKVEAFIKEASDNHLPEKQLSLYNDLVGVVRERYEATKHVARAIERSEKCVPTASEYFDNFFDLLNSEMALGTVPAFADAVFSEVDPFVVIPTGYFFCIKYPAFSSRLSDISRRKINDDLENPDVVRRVNRTNVCIKEMMQDEEVVKNISNMKDVNLYSNWTRCVNDACSSIQICQSKVNQFEEAVESALFDSSSWLTTNPVTAIYEITESVELNSAIDAQKYLNTRDFTNLLSVFIEMAEEEVTMGIRSVNDSDLAVYEDVYERLTTDMAIMEWEDDGTPNRVIQNQIMTSDERRKKAEEEERKKKLDASGCLSEEDALSEIRDVKKQIEKLAKTENMTSERFFTDSEKLKGDIVKTLSKEAQTYPEVKSALNALDEIKFETDEFTESGENEVPSDKDPNAKSPKKPKSPITKRIQNKALDTDANLRKKEAEAEEKIDELKTAGKAISYHPKMLKEKMDKTIYDFDKWDDNRRKEFLLKPGYRHKLFKKFRTLLEYGVAANMKLGFIPVLWSIKHLSKLKDNRIRNELAMELDNEIKICEEKISDASSRGENERKYELMRIKDKLDAERTRVRLNSKYV